MQEEPVFYTPEMQQEVREYVRQLEIELGESLPTNEREPEDLRDERENGTPAREAPVLSDKAIVRDIPTDHGNVSVRAFIPEGQINGVYLHIHGGGWVLGRAHHKDPELETIMNECEAAVISVDYRLAPESPYPAAQDDCEAAAVWVVENAPKEFGTENITIGGESAGAHLAAATMLRMRDRHGYTDFSGANLVYGAYDLSMTPSQQLWGDRLLVLSTPIMNWFYDHYVPKDMRRDPDVSPLYASLHNLAPALFTVGTLDPLLDDTLFMHSRWFASGNISTLHVYPGATHGFENQPTELASKVRGRMRDFIRESFQS